MSKLKTVWVVIYCFWIALRDKETRKWLFGKPSSDSTLFNSVMCRAKGHPEGPVYYNVCGLEPDGR